MFDLDYLAAPTAYGPCARCGQPRFYDRVTDAFVCIGCGERQDVSLLKRPPERLRFVDKLKKIEPLRKEQPSKATNGSTQTNQSRS